MVSCVKKLLGCALAGACLVLAPGPVTAQSDGVADEALAKLFPEGDAALVGPLAEIRLGETGKEEIERKRQALFDWAGLTRDELPGTVFRAATMRIRYGTRPDAVNEASISLPRGTGRAVLTKAWGEPVECRDPSGLRIDGKALSGHYWFNPEEGLRAVLVEHRNRDLLTYQRYVPAADLLGAKGDTVFGFERKLPLLGADPEQVVETYGKDVRLYADGGSGTLHLVHPTEFAGFGAQVLFRAKEGRIREVRFSLSYDHSVDARQEWMERLEEKFGRMEEFEENEKKQWLLAEDPKVTLLDQPGVESWQVKVSAPRMKK